MITNQDLKKNTSPPLFLPPRVNRDTKYLSKFKTFNNSNDPSFSEGHVRPLRWPLSFFLMHEVIFLFLKMLDAENVLFCLCKSPCHFQVEFSVKNNQF